ncbi:Adhesion G protein-coupled receptor E1, partial [Anabarilius grahami]
ECKPPICGENARCINTNGSYYCQCKEGFTPTHNFTQTDGTKCKDINECANGSNICGPNAECKNTVGSYSCTCETGYFSSNGNKTFIGGQGIQCNELKCNTIISESKAFQAYPELTKLVSLMTNSCLVLNESESVRKEHFTQVDGERLLEAFLSALDSLLHGGFQGDNHKVSAMFNIVESMLKLIGPLLSESQTKRSTSKTGFSTAALLSYEGLEESLNRYFNHLETQKRQTFKINSKVVTATVSNTETDKLQKPVNLTFSHLEVGCAVVAGVLHYFFLASFCWMCLEGVQLFRMVVLVFNTTLRPIYMIAAGYGVPAVIVAISATVNPSGYGTQGYCWLNIQDGFIWSFYGPVCAIIIVRDEYAKFLSRICTPQKSKYSEFSSNQTSKSQVNSLSVRDCLALDMWKFS